MDFAMNDVLKLEPDPKSKSSRWGTYRVIAIDRVGGRTALARIDESLLPAGQRGGRPPMKATKKPRKKPRPPNFGRLLWVSNTFLRSRQTSQQLRRITVKRDAKYHQAEIKLTDSGKARWETRKQVMAPFLDLQALEGSILAYGGVSERVAQAVEQSSSSRSLVYLCWSLMCRFGLDENSLLTDLDRCGAPGRRRFAGNGNDKEPARKKAGRKTSKERIHPALQINPSQPGMSRDWFLRILAGDALIPTPKPRSSQRYDKIILSHFVTDYRYDGINLVPVTPPVGEIPNRRQVRHVLETEYSELKRVIQNTTIGHYNRSLRGLRGRSWKSVAGPGYAWAIDSTIGDIYLRSSVCRHWIIGRPIVYVIVDVWSTAVMGFYVCLSGPSWATAKIALFNACVDPRFLGELWGYVPLYTLNPSPTRPYQIWCDRGEYLSFAASETFLKLIPCASYMPPYRPDLKGIVEVLHRIQKDALNQTFTPGAIDARRAEYELRQFDPTRSAMTLREFVQWLQIHFTVYNFSADRRKRVDDHMLAAGVTPTPAGLWRFGHECGIGYRVYTELDDLISKLLPLATGKVINGGVTFHSALYDTAVPGLETWSPLARLKGVSELPMYHYPGTLSRIWTPYGSEKGLTCLNLSDQSASSELSLDEHIDAMALGSMNLPEQEHARTTVRLQGLAMADALSKQALAKTQKADAEATGARPLMTEARQAEAPTQAPSPALPTDPATAPSRLGTSSSELEANLAYLQQMKADLLAHRTASTPGGGDHA